VEQRKQIIRSFVSRGLRVNIATRIGGIGKSTYYYKSNGLKKGKKPMDFTWRGDKLCSNQEVVNEILDIISPEYLDYGYHTVTIELRRRNYLINHKKVYRLMKENNLLNPVQKRGKDIKKEYVKMTVPPLEGPFVTVEIDIKYIRIHEQNRNAYLLTFLCTFTRFAPVWALEYSMTANKIASMVNEFIFHPSVKAQNPDPGKLNVKIRSDNGPQFIAKKLAEILEGLRIKHEFIRPATPQQNGHIESFHNTVARLVYNKNIFMDLDHAKKIFTDFFNTYNYQRMMPVLLYYSPYQFLKLWNIGNIGITLDKNRKEKFFLRKKPTPEEVSLDLHLFGFNKINSFVNHFYKP
jgi:putative transposase